MRTPLLTVLFSVSLVTGVLTGYGQEPEPLKIKLDTSFVFTRGDYGLPQNTDVSIAMMTPSVAVDGWTIQAAIPYVHLNGPATIVGNTGASTVVSKSSHGIGDLTLSVGHKVFAEKNGWSGEFAIKEKFPTADDTKGLGTGESDTQVQFDVYRKGGEITPFGSVGYQFLGRNASYPMRNGAYVTAGFTSEVSPGLTAGLAGNWRQAIIDGGKSGVEAMAFVQKKFSETRRVQVFALHGFTDASPNLAIGLTVGLGF